MALFSFKSYLKNKIPAGTLFALHALKNELRTNRLHNQGVKKAKLYAEKRDLKINFGCGSNKKDGWLNIDLQRNADLTLDLRRDIPLLSASCQITYSEHFFEHLDYPYDAMHFLRECFRILRPNGVFAVGVPDTEPYMGAYANKQSELFDTAKRIWHPSWCKTSMEHINYLFRQGNEHRFAYDFETLKTCLSDAGFISIRRRDFDPQIDSESRRLGTLYVEARKPS